MLDIVKKDIINWRTEKRKIEELNPAEYNPRQWPEKETKDLEISLDKFNLADPLVINLNNTIIGGHFRFNILKQKGISEIDVRVPSRQLSQEEERELNLRLNKNLGSWDFDALANFDEDLLKDVGFDSKELDKIFELDIEEKDNVIPEINEECNIKEGDLFQMGEHRLLCGSSIDKANIKKIMQGEKATACITDPPYSVNYKSRKEEISETLASYQDPNDAKELLYGFMSIMPSDILIMTYADKQLHPYVLTCEQLGFETIDLLIWEKQNFCFWPGARYQQQHELIFIARHRGGAIINNVPSNQSTIFQIDRKMKNDIHPTQRPLELFEKLIIYHTNRGDIVYEPFGGSGTTLIACEKLNRKCRAIEISPQFCQVIIKRWEDYTGKKAQKLN